MATISLSLKQIKSQLQTLMPDELIERLCRQAGHRWRKRVLDPAVTLRLMVLQLLSQVSMCGLRHVSSLNVSGEAIRKAKLRLPLKVLTQILQGLCPSPKPRQMWHDLKVYIVDGMSFLTQDTPELAGKYGKARNGKKRVSATRGQPAPKLLILLDLASGFVHQAIALPWSRQERTCLGRLLKIVGKKALLLADRGLSGFGQMAILLQNKTHACIRLPRCQAVFGRGKASRRCLRKLGKQDLLVRWNKTRRASWMSKLQWRQLPDSLVLRQIAYRIVRKGHRTRWAWIITTLTDVKEYPAEELVELYGKRWQIEVCFRHIKKTLGLKLTTAKKIFAVRQQVLATLILYNLIRQVTCKAARNQKVTPDRISFIDAMRWLLYGDPDEPLPPLIVNPIRVRASQPRQIKNTTRKYARLTQPRAALAKPPCYCKL